MKINIHPNYNMYKRTSDLGPATPHQAPAETGRTDLDSITRGSTAVAGRQLLALKSGVIDYVSAPAYKSHLDSIRAGVQNGTYHIPTADIVSSIMLDE